MKIGSEGAIIENRSEQVELRHETETYDGTSQYMKKDVMLMQIQIHLGRKPKNDSRTKGIIKGLVQSQDDALVAEALKVEACHMYARRWV